MKSKDYWLVERGNLLTPERNDGQDIFKYLDDRTSAEIRLTEAINRKLLSPFQYFSVSDNVVN